MTALGSLTWPEVEKRAGEGAGLVVPLGATEQHGPHLGLNTDTRIAEALAYRLVGRARTSAQLDLIVAPALPYGSSGEHADFPGTLSIGQSATELMIVELVRSARLTFGFVVLVCGHGGNAGPLNRAMTTLVAESPEVLALRPSWGDGSDLHAGRTETSIMLSIDPHAVDQGQLEAGTVAEWDEIGHALMKTGVRSVSANGVLGDPSTASATEGEALLAQAVDRLWNQLDQWLGRPR